MKVTILFKISWRFLVTTNGNTRNVRIFISHRNTELSNEEAKCLYKALHEFNPFLDIYTLDAGEEWKKEIYEHIHYGDVLVVLLEEETASEWVQREIDIAR